MHISRRHQGPDPEQLPQCDCRTFQLRQETRLSTPRSSTEADSANRVPEDDKRENEVFVPDQIDLLLSEAPLRLVPSMAIKAFSGVRTEEMAFMEWKHVHFRRGKGYIILPKTGHRRKAR
jgi:hypothetical protein